MTLFILLPLYCFLLLAPRQVTTFPVPSAPKKVRTVDELPTVHLDAKLYDARYLENSGLDMRHETVPFAAVPFAAVPFAANEQMSILRIAKFFAMLRLMRLMESGETNVFVKMDHLAANRHLVDDLLVDVEAPDICDGGRLDDWDWDWEWD